MTAVNTLYHKHKITGTNHAYRVLLYKEHEIFSGHFPFNPILPGVCLLDIISDCVEQCQLDAKLLVIHKVKFLEVIDPRQNNDIRVELKLEYIGNKILVAASAEDFAFADRKFLTYKGTFEMNDIDQ